MVSHVRAAAACMVMLLRSLHAFIERMEFDSWSTDKHIGTNRMVLAQIGILGKMCSTTRFFSSWHRLKKSCVKHHSGTKFRYQLNLGT